jgi:hypothetical protein
MHSLFHSSVDEHFNESLWLAESPKFKEFIQDFIDGGFDDIPTITCDLWISGHK